MSDHGEQSKARAATQSALPFRGGFGNVFGMTPSDYIDAQAADMLGLLRRLVGVATINPPGDLYGPMTELLRRELELSGLKASRMAISAREMKASLPAELQGFPRYNVLGFLRPPGARRTVHFNAHYDVVPVSGSWRHGSPFSGCVEGGWIYGRGTGDMKGSMASLLLALRALRAAGIQPLHRVEVSFTADEETDSLLGSGWVVQHAPIDPDFVVVMEGGEGESVCCGHNGVVWLNVTVQGKAAHGSKPEDGINALEKMSALVLALEDYKRRLKKRQLVAPDGVKMHPTINVGGVFSSGEGGKINTVPALARFSIDRRVIAKETVASAERELRAFLTSAARQIPDCRILVEKVSENHPCFVNPQGPFFRAFADIVSDVRGKKARFGVSTGFNDMQFFAEHLGVPTIGYGPGGQNYHAVDERAKVRDLLSAAKIYARLLTTPLG